MEIPKTLQVGGSTPSHQAFLHSPSPSTGSGKPPPAPRLKCCSDCLTAELELQEFGVLRVCAACLKFSPHAKRALKQEDKDHLYNTMR